MRKDLERMALFGFWTIDDAGAEVGQLNCNTYSYEQVKKKGHIEFIPFKISISGRKTKIHNRIETCKDLTKFEKVKSKFMQDIVLGNI